MVTSGVPDQRFAEYVIQTKLVSSEQVEEAKRSQVAAASIGIEISLAEALVRMKALTTSQRGVVEQRLGTQPSSGIHQLGPYKLLRRIGTGAMGVVYLAEDTMAQRQVALKVLARELATNPGFLEQFHREAVASGKLNHANLITAYNFSEDRGWRYYVMEYCPGESAEQLLERRGPVPWPQALRLIRDAAQGLHYAHQLGIIHRDVKPGNIMVTPEGVGRLLDMGLSKQLLDREDKSGHTVGTPHYISPEQARGEQSLDGRADIYSLGATLFHLLTGRPPFAGNDAVAVMRQHLSVPVPDPAALRADIPERISRMVQRMMAKDPAQRYTDCAELIADLDLALVAEEPTAAVSMKPSSGRPPKGVSPTHRQGAIPPSIWGGQDDGEPRGDPPASVRSDAHRDAPVARPSSSRPGHAPSRGRYVSEAEVLAARPRMKQNAWVWPVTGASAVLILLGALLLSTGSGGNPNKKKAQADPTTPAPNGKKPALPTETTTPEKNVNPPATTQPPTPVETIPPLPPTRDVDNEERWKSAVDLLNLLDLTADPVQGFWRYVNHNVTNDITPRARLKLPFRPPSEYDFRVVFTRTKGDEVTQIVTWKGKGTAWVMGAMGNTASGFLRSNTELSPPFEAQEARGLTNAERHSSVIEVRKDRVRGYLDGQLVSEWTGDSEELTWHPGWDLPKKAQLGLGSHNAAVLIHSIQVLDVSGTGQALRKASPLNGPGGITDDWKNALALLPPEEQIKHINVKLQQFNPGFTGNVSMHATEGRLTFINLMRAQLGNLSPIQGLPHLAGIGLGGLADTPSPVTDLSVLRGLRLGYLDCSYSKVSDLTPLAGTKLAQLICHHAEVNDLSPLEGMPLNKLACNETKVQDLKPLAGMRLAELDCSKTGVKDLAPLKGMPLTKLDLHGTGIKDLSVLSGMPLVELNIGDTKVSDFSPLRGLKLTTCRVGGMGLKDVNFLKGMPVSNLNVNGNALTDLSSIQGLPLMELRLSYNPISDLSPLRGKPIQSLALRDTKVTALDALAGMPLHTLDIRGLVIKNPAILKTLPLKEINLDYSPAQHAELLRSIKTLERINFSSAESILPAVKK